MKVNKWFIVFILLLLGIFVATEYNMPGNFDWTPTFSRYDKQPFGMAIFDDVLSHSLPDGYSVEGKTFFQLEQDSLRNTAILAVDEHLYLERIDLESMLNLANAGNKVMLVAHTFGYFLSDSLRLNTTRDYSNFSRFKTQISLSRQRDTLIWLQDSLFGENKYSVYSQLLQGYFNVYDSLATVLAVRNRVNTGGSLAVAISCPIGEGDLYLVTTPLLFTNYGMLDENNAEYIFRLLTQMKGMPLIRTEGYGRQTQVGARTPLRYFLSQPPLRWGIYLAFISLVVFMVFTARRRQRAIPVVGPPENKAVEFIELIGTLYFRKADHVGIIRNKYVLFAETLRRTIQVDLDDAGDDETRALVISQKTGVGEQEISRLLISLRRVLDDKNAYMTENLMKEYIDRMNKITNQI